MTQEKTLKAFAKLGREMMSLATEENLRENEMLNPWFTREFSVFALESLSKMLHKKKLYEWAARYPHKKSGSRPKTIAVITAGNIPLVGFHDFMCVLVSGNNFLGKISHKDNYLFSKISELLIKIDPGFSEKITFTDEKPGTFDAIIATGSDNSANYFEYYFKKYPHIIRKNRNSVAVLTGDETEEDLKYLAKDVFLYFGKGCRNVSKIYLPEKYDFKQFEKPFSEYKHLMDHNKYINNFDYYKSIYLLNREEYYDAGNILLKKSSDLSSPISVLYYENYGDICNLADTFISIKDRLQCVISNSGKIPGAIGFGKAQQPEIDDYADGVDTMKFLSERI
ncbi:MAG: hypothetical protein A2W91_00850 [Bacteroidetes bacterium GWF2_38_335]|nr:MAG: hypothetical protein A2W91_00850 [Bacteroidetes bacterium GWF2_38_335]OFY80304.1 MAG: hypothetical protein A2281_17360 [Bacteroidetes bacterium RIFOXYA12_FULL_38_20]HBS88897.1 acyl-CoA reductase [Bacteroidales bacterium]